ncbi:MAG TPA: DUF5703 domain-containing protein [Niabella sp.]|nr:DUF5703 domain-containing protein [Niabella sp.]
MRFKLVYTILLLGLCFSTVSAQLNTFNIIWQSQSESAAGSMPVGGGDIGCNVWVEDNELLLYFSKSGSFDENNAFLKSGRLRLKLSPNPFSNSGFKQELVVKDGYVHIQSSSGGITAAVKIWVDVFHPVIHIDIKSNKSVHAEAFYENWRFADRLQKGKENNANSWKWASHVPIITRPDDVEYDHNNIIFYHRNTGPTVFDATVKQQGLDSVKNQLFNPLKNLTSGGLIKGAHFVKGTTGEGIYRNTAYKSRSLVSKKAAKQHTLQIYLHNSQAAGVEDWKKEALNLTTHYRSSHQRTIDWWNDYWKRSFIFINADEEAGVIKKENDEGWQVGRNYQLFRYMLGDNAYGSYPTKFNGGLFTVDPVFTDSSIKGTPDHRNWGGGTFTAQNQRLVYWPMLKSGDADMMKPQFDFYNRLLQTAILRTKIYWGHAGANFNEQIENFGFPNPTEYGWKRPSSFDPGVEYNAWLEYEWDTVLEFCMMILQSASYTDNNISAYLPLIKNSLIFFDEHYQYQAKKLSNKALDGNGHLILYPGSGAETFKMAYNASSTIAALKTVTDALLKSSYLTAEEKTYFESFEKRIPPLPFMNYNGQPTLAPAKLWARVNNVESSQLYPVYPWGLYGIGRPGLDTARNTYLLDTFALKFRSHKGWKQDNIFAARLGLTDDAKKLTVLKLQNSERRFPAFWGPGFDWVPDHNWGGSGMIGLQEMLMQTVDDKIYLFPAWPKDWNVHFKLHAPQQTTVEATLKNGKIQSLIVWPREREKDIVLMIK